VQAVQIEVRRSLYMDEETFEKLPCFNEIAGKLHQVNKVIRTLMS